MKQILSILIVLLIIGCGSSEKKTQKTAPPPAPTYSYTTPTQEMLDSGKTTFEKYCFICHKEGVGGAEKLTDKVRWTNNRTKDLVVLIQHVNDGYTGEYGTMTPKGTCMECSNDDLRDAIFYMMTEAGLLE
ncbi:MAG: cytochrome c5 family protein [Candidatus Marinimicrobia bacterium]|nr:cytochrome c5 family protein [Candidatus Neomarinimicrobiota bacterium]